MRADGCIKHLLPYSPTLPTQPKQRQRMPLNGKICLFAYKINLLFRQTNIDLYDAVALGAGQVVVVAAASADAVVVRAVGEFDAV